MKAILSHQPEEVAKPIPTDHQVLIKVSHAGVNRADLLQAQGLYPPPKGESNILGLEVSGIVEAVGKSCKRYQVGDQVFALLAGGGYAEYVAVDEGSVMPVPKNVSLEAAAGIAEVFITAYQALFWLADLQAGETVLIHAGASGVGTAAIQLAKQAGAKVIVTTSSDYKIEACMKLGADFGINYKEDDFAARIKEITQGKGVNVIIDFVGASYYEKNSKSMAMDGRWVVLGMLGGRFTDGFDFGRLLMKRIKLMGSTLRARDLEYKTRLITSFSERFLADFTTQQLAPVIDCVFNWNDMSAAFDYVKENKNVGKVILSISSS